VVKCRRPAHSALAAKDDYCARSPASRNHPRSSSDTIQACKTSAGEQLAQRLQQGQAGKVKRLPMTFSGETTITRKSIMHFFSMQIQLLNDAPESPRHPGGMLAVDSDSK
jgi:hypothetical protein